MQAGIKFNKDNHHRYPNNEVRQANKRVMDSYDHKLEIIERKHSQFARILPRTAIAYLQSIIRKYEPGNVIADTPENRRQCPELVGKRTDGQLICEVPVQDEPIPREVLDAADTLGVTIWDVEGKVYNP